MEVGKAYCEDCVETIPNDEVYWEEERLYCRRCGSEVEIPRDNLDLYDQMVGQGINPVFTTDGGAWDEDEEEEEENKEQEAPKPTSTE